MSEWKDIRDNTVVTGIPEGVMIQGKFIWHRFVLKVTHSNHAPSSLMWESRNDYYINASQCMRDAIKLIKSYNDSNDAYSISYRELVALNVMLDAEITYVGPDRPSDPDEAENWDWYEEFNWDLPTYTYVEVFDLQTVG